MKKLENITENEGFNLSKVVRQIVITVIVIILFAILFATGQILFLIQIFTWIESQVRAFTGLDSLLAKAISVLIMGVLLALPLWAFIFSFLPVPQKNKRGKRLIVMSVFALMFVASFFASKQVYFNPDSGKPMKYYSISPEGEYKFSTSDGYDPVTGDKLQPITKDIVIKHLDKKEEVDGVISRVKKSLQENRRLSDDEQAALETEQAVLREKEVRDAIASGNSIRLDIKNFSGIEKTADFYQIKVFNDLTEKVYFVVSAKIESEDETQAFALPAKSSLSLSLCEGNHYFSFLDVNGHQIRRASLSHFANYNSYIFCTINGQQYDSSSNHIVPIPKKVEIRLSD
jgi:hypothetical protein